MTAVEFIRQEMNNRIERINEVERLKWANFKQSKKMEKMTAVEKAQELVKKFTFSCRECDNARLSALIAVDEIIEQLEYIYIHKKNGMGELNYWYEVKHELNKSE